LSSTTNFGNPRVRSPVKWGDLSTELPKFARRRTANGPELLLDHKQFLVRVTRHPPSISAAASYWQTSGANKTAQSLA
jgi:hypothetical protein